MARWFIYHPVDMDESDVRSIVLDEDPRVRIDDELVLRHSRLIPSGEVYIANEMLERPYSTWFTEGVGK